MGIVAQRQTANVAIVGSNLTEGNYHVIKIFVIQRYPKFNFAMQMFIKLSDNNFLFMLHVNVKIITVIYPMLGRYHRGLIYLLLFKRYNPIIPAYSVTIFQQLCFFWHVKITNRLHKTLAFCTLKRSPGVTLLVIENCMKIRQTRCRTLLCNLKWYLSYVYIDSKYILAIIILYNHYYNTLNINM